VPDRGSYGNPEGRGNGQPKGRIKATTKTKKRRRPDPVRAGEPILGEHPESRDVTTYSSRNGSRGQGKPAVEGNLTPRQLSKTVEDGRNR